MPESKPKPNLKLKAETAKQREAEAVITAADVQAAKTFVAEMSRAGTFMDGKKKAKLSAATAKKFFESDSV